VSTRNPSWTDLEWNPGLRGDRPVTNRLNYGKALKDKREPDLHIKTQFRTPQ